MSLQDDVWDVEDALMGTAAAKSYARIVKRLWAQGDEIAKLKEAMADVEDYLRFRGTGISTMYADNLREAAK